MSVQTVAIVGRPNVGKSSLFNWLAGKQISIVDPTAGVTRDRVNYLMHVGDRYFEMVDTGGIGVVDSDDLSDQIEQQINLGIERADLLLFVVDAQTGITPLDREVAQRIRHIDRPKLLIANKCDSPKLDQEVFEFLSILNAPIIATSVTAKRNKDLLLTGIVENLPPADEHEAEEGIARSSQPELKLAIVGRRNVGKSTFINALSQEERVIVSEIAGTTRDSIDIRFDMDGKTFVAIDTPGVRKKKSLANDIEFYGLVRAQRSIRRADVVYLFFDATNTISRLEKQLADEIVKQYKPCIFVVNKWDLGTDAEMTTEKWTEYLTAQFAQLRHVPIAFITAQDSRNIKQLVNLTQAIYKQAMERVSTGKLNRLIRAAMKLNPPPYRQNKRPKIYYATQVGVQPPTIVLKCNHPELFDETWKRYLHGILREELPFKEVPIRVFFRAKDQHETDSLSLEDNTHIDDGYDLTHIDLPASRDEVE
ncbi:GTPase Der [Polystyrenella longa]|uniref:GTPase Der n=1 Tax=Polystyrenella longa TaxID=2528007 RepID=A0A518CJE3_9PLAN|nr:ribosome biogenesis GTPase Der [Polystyrenella longa]QDU79342.1 GTPase Der [Polystyrenella longa]